MPLGATSQQVSWAGSSSVSVEYVCPDCGAHNMTQGINAGLAPDLAPTVFARVTCPACNHDMLVTVSYSAMHVIVQQTS